MKVLFVCEGNMMRSQLAERLYNHLSDSNDATSAGALATGLNRVSKNGAVVMKEIGLSLDGQTSKQLTEAMIRDADKVILFPTDYMPDYALSSSKAEFWDVADPHYAENRTLDTDRAVRDEIAQRVKELIGTV